MDINKLRYDIDAVDIKIIQLLEKRIEIVKEIGKLKKSNDIKIYCYKREQEIYKRLTSNTNLDYSFVVSLWEIIMSYSKSYQLQSNM
jgi:chorismate mutase